VWGVFICPDMNIMKVYRNLPFESRLISKHDVCYELWVYKTICEELLAKYHSWTTAMRSEGWHLLHVLRVKWLSVENSADNGENWCIQQLQFFEHPLRDHLTKTLAKC
jgi:hypothetical protein